MTVRREKRRDPKTGAVREFWFVDVDVELPDQQRKRVRKVSPIQTRRDAERYEQELRRAILDGSYGRKPAIVDVPTISAFVPRLLDDHYRAERLKPSTIAAAEQVLKHNVEPVLGRKRLDAISNADVQKLKASLAHLQPKTVNNSLAALRVLLRKAVEWGVIAAVPCTIKLLKVHRGEMAFYDFDDFERLVASAATIDARLHLAVLLAGDAGMRMGEVAALEWSRVVFSRNVVVIAASEWRGELTATKGGRVREVPMTARLATALKEQFKSRRTDSDRVLTLDDGRPWHREMFRKRMMKAERGAGLEVAGRFHILRHTFCARLAMRGAPAKAIQELAGHADLKTTERYMHVSPAARTSAIALLEPPPQANGNATATAAEVKENPR